MRHRVLQTVAMILVLSGWMAGPVWPQEYNLAPPETPVNLLWIHHSTGAYWSHKLDYGVSRTWNDGVAGVRRGPDDGIYATRHDAFENGGNGEVALYNNNYILHHLSYGSTLADGEHYTDYCHWYRKFRRYLDSGDATNYVNDVGGEDLVHCYAQDISYSEQGSDEFTSANVSAHTNQVIMFKSCFPNSAIAPPDTSGGLPANPTISDARAWVAPGGGYWSWEVANPAAGPINFIQAEYLALLDVFGEARYRNILFVAWVAPPEVDSTSAYALALSNWFENEWLSGYAHNNVLLFNFWATQAGETEGPAFMRKHNHSRYNPFIGGRDYVGPGDPDYVDSLRTAFDTWGDSHPSHFGGAVATKEFIHLLNIQWNRLHNVAPSGPTGYPTNGRTAFFPLDSSYTGSLPTPHVSHGTIDGVDCLIFDGTASATLNLGDATVVGPGGAFSYCYWYRPNDDSVTTYSGTPVLTKEEVFSSIHYADYEIDSHINTTFGGEPLVSVDHHNNLVDNETWTHVTFTYNGSEARNYIDGVQIMETTATVRTVTDNANPLVLGGGATDYLAGGIREVAIYSRALTPADVRQIFNANAGAMQPSLVRSWREY